MLPYAHAAMQGPVPWGILCTVYVYNMYVELYMYIMYEYVEPYVCVQHITCTWATGAVFTIDNTGS